MRPGFKSRRRHHMWFEFVVGSLLCSERFFSGYSNFPLSSKINISKFPFDQESNRRRTVDVLPLNHYLYIYLFCLGIKFGFILCSIRLRGIKQKKLNHHEAKPWINNTFLLIFLTGLTEPSMKFNIISKLVYFRAFWRSTIEVLEII